MAEIRYIADPHFGHSNIITFDKRPFDSVESMDAELIDRWNSVVRNGDTTYIIGDFCWLKPERWIEILKKLRGNKVLIRGNHDFPRFGPNLKKYFTDIKDYKCIRDRGRKVIMSHFPMLFYAGSYDPNTYMLCGHVHTTAENVYLDKWRREMADDRERSGGYGVSQAHVFNVGCMLPYMNYTPRTLDEIIEGVKDYDGRN